VIIRRLKLSKFLCAEALMLTGDSDVSQKEFATSWLSTLTLRRQPAIWRHGNAGEEYNQPKKCFQPAGETRPGDPG